MEYFEQKNAGPPKVPKYFSRMSRARACLDFFLAPRWCPRDPELEVSIRHATSVRQGTWFSVAKFQRPLSNTRPLHHRNLVRPQ